MLNTLLKIGQWQSQGKSQWDRFLEFPKVENQDKNGNEIKNYILPIVFDLDEGEIVIDETNLFAFDVDYLERLKAIKTKPGQNKAIYATAPKDKLNQIYKTFFSKEDSKSNNGELVEAIRKVDKKILTADFEELLNSIFKLKEKFNDKFLVINSKDEKEISTKIVEEDMKMGPNEKIVLITICVKQADFTNGEIVYFSDLPEYISFLEFDILKSTTKAETPSEFNKKLCYASGKLNEEVSVMDLPRRDSLNKMFGYKTLLNYISDYEKSKAKTNYQISESSKELLDVASAFLVDPNRMVRIAGIRHCLIPEFISFDDIELQYIMSSLKSKSDILFSFRSLDNFNREVISWTDNIFWINFLAVDMPRDKKYFKIQEVIKDVSVFHFEKVIKTFLFVDNYFSSIDGVNWERIRGNIFFNLYSVHQLLPVRKSITNYNFDLIKSIFENKKVDIGVLYHKFCELLLCYYYQRFDGYENIKKPLLDDFFSLYVKSSTYKYLAFFEVLKKLNLIDMNEETHVSPSEQGNKYDEAINAFFEKMNLNAPQQAMFYLGRMLNAVEFIQKDKKKTVINKVNFNGMDRDDVQRLRLALIEKAKQYSKVGKVIFTDSKFGGLFNYNHWNMNPQEAVFFLMTGYSFGISTKEASQLEETESEETEN